MKTELNVSVIIHTIAKAWVDAINLFLYYDLGDNIGELLKAVKGALLQILSLVKLVYNHDFVYLLVWQQRTCL